MHKQTTMEKNNIRMLVQDVNESAEEFAQRIERICGWLATHGKQSEQITTTPQIIAVSSASDGRQTATIQWKTEPLKEGTIQEPPKPKQKFDCLIKSYDNKIIYEGYLSSTSEEEAMKDLIDLFNSGDDDYGMDEVSFHVFPEGTKEKQLNKRIQYVGKINGAGLNLQLFIEAGSFAGAFTKLLEDFRDMNKNSRYNEDELEFSISLDLDTEGEA